MEVFPPPQLEQRRLVVATIIGYFALFDLLFLPQFPLLIMPYSLPLIAAVLVWSLRIECDEQFLAFVLLGVAVLGSAGLSTFFYDQETVLLNAKRAIQFLIPFAYYFFFRWLAARTTLRVKGLLLAFVAYYLCWAAYFVYSPNNAEASLLRLYPTIGPGMASHLLFLRFAFFFEDSNSAAYFFLIVVGFLFTTKRLKPLGAVLLVVVGLCGVLVTQSRGALFAALLMLIFGLVNDRHVVRQHVKWVGFAVALVAALGIGLFAWLNLVAGGTTYGSLLARLVRSRVLQAEGITEGRPAHYAWAVTHLLPLPLGRGYSLFQNGDIFRPHSDHLRLLYSYGIIAYLATIQLLFRRLFRAPALVFPALMAFSINTLIDDNKLMGLFLSLLAIWLVSGEGNAQGDLFPPPPESGVSAPESLGRGSPVGRTFA